METLLLATWLVLECLFFLALLLLLLISGPLGSTTTTSMRVETPTGHFTDTNPVASLKRIYVEYYKADMGIHQLMSKQEVDGVHISSTLSAAATNLGLVTTHTVHATPT